MLIGILQTGEVPPELAEDCGEYPDMFEALLTPFGHSFKTWSVVRGDFPNGPDDAEGWLVTGSRHGVYEDHPWIPPLAQLIRDIVAADRPLIGVCFGHQMIAQALGGRVEKFDGGWAVGPQVYDFPDGPKKVMAWHQDQVLTPPEGAQTIASNDFCTHAALVYPGKAYTVQSHPEFDHRFIGGLIDTRGPGVVPDALLQEASDHLHDPLDRNDIAAQFDRFFRERSLS